jgi:CubicO group peptidase (beta-lactamase class C family)
MLKRSALFLATLVLLQAPSSYADTLPAAAMVDPALAARIDASIARYYKPADPGATVIVTRDGQTVFRKAYGMADVARHVAMTPDSVLRIGSITKQFTSTAILMLADEGKLSVSDDISKYLPGYPTHGKQITIEHLLTHTSGIVSYTSKPSFRDVMAKDMTVAQMIDSFKNDKLDFEPGAQWRYNNSGYFLLGAIIEKLSGMPYAKFVEQRIFVPLGMNNTAYAGYERGAAPRAAGHTGAPGRYEPSTPLSMALPYAAGALVSTVDDLARWDAAVSSGKLLKAASWQQAFTPYTLDGGAPTKYGYGWMFDKVQGAPAIGHGGGINGFRSFALRVPSEKLYVAVLTNSDAGLVAPEVVANKVAALAIGKPYREFAEIRIAPAALDAYAGAYQVDDKVSRTMRVEDGKLVMERTGRSSVTLVPYAADGFFIPDSLDYLEFARDAGGAVTQLTYHQGDTVSVHPRTAALAERQVIKVPAALLDTYLGRYQITPDIALDITRTGERLFGQASGQPRMELFAMTETLFFTREINAQVRFNKDADGAPQVLVSHDGRNMRGKKVR